MLPSINSDLLNKAGIYEKFHTALLDKFEGKRAVVGIIREYMDSTDGKGLFLVGENGCFREGTLVRTSTGLKRIEAIAAGDEVLSLNTIKGTTEFMPVVKTFKHKGITIGQDMITFELPTCKIVCTANHEFYYEGTWVRAESLARRIMEGSCELEQTVLCQQHGKAFDYTPPCSRGVPPKSLRHYEASIGQSRLFENDAFNEWPVGNGENSPGSRRDVDTEPFGTCYGKPQEVYPHRQQGDGIGVDVFGGQYRPCGKSREAGGEERRGLREQQIDKFTGTRDESTNSEKGEVLWTEGISSDLRCFRSDGEKYRYGEDLDAHTIDLKEVLSVSLNLPDEFVYDLSVANNHNYCITEKNIVVHNCGKSYLVCAAFIELLSRGLPVYRVHAQTAHQWYLDKNREKMKLISGSYFLCIDDFGKEHYDSPAAAALSAKVWDAILRYRVERNRPTWFTSNIDLTKIRQMYGDSLASLLMEAIDVLPVTAKADHRKRGFKYHEL